MQTNADLLVLLRNDEQDILAIVEKCRDIEYFNSLITSAKKYKLLPNILDILIRVKSTLRNDSIKKLYEENREIQEKYVHNQLETIESISDIFSQDKIVWLKGIPLSVLIYDDPLFRRVGDIDLLVDSSIQKDFVNNLVNRGYKKYGIINDDIGLRYSVHHHEIQLMSPSSCYFEIKTISGEMNTVNCDNLVTDFFAHTMDIEMGGRTYKTLDLTYSLLHLFLSAFSNSTIWYHMGENGLRDIYEILLFTKKYDIDYNKLYEVADTYGICSIILGTMEKINKIFGVIFEENILSIFSNQTHKPQMIAELYKYFTQHYVIDYIDELFDEEMKYRAYCNAICDAYYNYDIAFEKNYLSPEILDYNLTCTSELFTLDLCIDSKYYYDYKESKFIMNFLCSNKELHDIYGYVFVITIKFESGTAKVSLFSETIVKDMQTLNIDIQPEVLEVIEDKVHMVVNFEPIFFNSNINKICYNVQLVIQNENDKGKDGFCITILCPGRNTLPLFHTDYLDTKIDKKD